MPTFFAEHQPCFPGYSQTKTLVSGSGFRSTSQARRKWKRTVSGASRRAAEPSTLSIRLPRGQVNHLHEVNQHGGLLFLDLLLLLQKL